MTVFGQARRAGVLGVAGVGRPRGGALGRSGGARRAVPLVVVLLLAVAAGARGAEGAADSRGWQRVREEDGIALFRRAGGAVPAFRAVAIVEASLPHVLAVLRDVPRHVEWRSRCTEARILSEESPQVAVLYTRTAGSWPVSDRDVVLRSHTRVAGPDAARIDLEASESPLAPEREDAVRMGLTGSYVLRSEGPERTRVEYRMRVSLGGAVPGWIARFVTEDMPVSTLAGLRRQAESTRGAYEAFERAWPEAAARGGLPRASGGDGASP